MTYALCRTFSILTTLIALPSAAMAEDYSTVGNTAFPGWLMSSSTLFEAGSDHWVSLTPAASMEEQNGNLFSQQWYQQDITEGVFKIKLRGATVEACLTLKEHPELEAVVVVAPCSPDGAQLWAASDTEPTRLYNNAYAEEKCMTAITSGPFSTFLTMTECGTGDVSTELWTPTDVAQ